jgi:aminoglycoside 6'-N-acetyltransferase I
MNAPRIQIRIREIALKDAPVWERMRCDLWPDGVADHAAEIASFFAGTLDEPSAVLMAESVSGTIVGFAELSIRGDVASLKGKQVGYVEGLYVIPEARQRGVAVRLLRAARTWVQQHQCTAFASDRSDRIIVDPSF